MHTLHLVRHQARLVPDTFTVFRPARTPARALLVDADWFLNAWFGREAAELTAGLCALAAASPRALVHLPIRADAAADGGAGGRPLDLVLLHHSLQFAPSRWKELRGRLGPGRPRTVDLPCSGADRAERSERTGRMDRHDWAQREVLRQHVHGDTLFLTGSTRTFRRSAGLFADLARNGPAQAAAFPDSHYCRRLYCGPRDRELHVEYSAD
ncbi:hypothetical protein HYE82_16765 [Streptomyces sp. BR123]|uniref:hypothetical protein n=1 Tax=Streptomyces sp. BR123 TaxID=2749828 RepID=UPI0015C4385C|nr:hypothetical protein [Streptomyces sp. BR123]NXY96012.1 hypothetical protein [Streptomyces sp. BR123]